jgi:hypothetical protein
MNGSKVRKKLGIRADHPVVLFARHFRPMYGVEYLIKAIPQAIREYP